MNSYHEYQGMENTLHYLRGSELVRLSKLPQKAEVTGILALEPWGKGQLIPESSSLASRSVSDFLLREHFSELQGFWSWLCFNRQQASYGCG